MEVKNKNFYSWWGSYKDHVRGVVLEKEIDKQENYTNWRNVVFCNILIYLTPLSLIALIPSVFITFTKGYTMIAYINMFAFFVLFLLNLVPEISIKLRKVIAVFIIFALALTLLYYLPLKGPGLIYLFSVTIFSSLIYSTATGYLSAYINTAIVLIYALLIYWGIAPLYGVEINLWVWIAVSSNVIFLSFACTKCLDILLSGLTASLKDNAILGKAIENERQRFYDLFSSGPSSMGVLSGPNHVFEIVNPIYLQLIGKKEIIGKTVKEVLPEAEDQGFIKLLDEVYQTGKSFSANEMVIQLDNHGTGKLVDNYLNFMYKAHRTEGNVIDGILFFAVDVTEQVLLRHKIEESEARLKEAQGIAKISNWEIDLRSNFYNWSSKFLIDVFGIKEKDKPQSMEDLLSHIHPEDIIFTRQKMENMFEGFEASSMDFRILSEDGTIKYAYSEWKYKFGPDYKPIMIHGILQDVTERKTAEIERENLIQELLQRNRALEQFTFIISHNLRAPTANLIGFTECLQDVNISTEERKLLLSGLASSAADLDTIIKDINAILQVKLDANENKEIISFTRIVNEIMDSNIKSLDKHGVSLNTDFSEVDELYSIKIFLQSIFYNLISNSIKYRQPNVNPVIKISSKKDKNKIFLKFSDNGLGIDLKTKGDKVFGLYNRFHTHVEGKGMGLYIVKTQVEAIGGKINVSSFPNKGTEFNIVFTV